MSADNEKAPAPEADGGQRPTKSPELSPAIGEGERSGAKKNSPDSFLRVFSPGPWFLAAIYPQQSKTDAKQAPHFAHFGVGEEQAMLAWISKENQTRNIYFHLNPLLAEPKKGKASKADVAAVVALHVDIDPRAGEDLASERARILGLLRDRLPPGVPPPTAIVDSGGGFQAMWLLRQPVLVGGDEAKAAELERYTQQLEILFGADNCRNVDRILRMPGTVNRPDWKKRAKGRTEAPAEVVALDPQKVYDLSDFVPAKEVAQTSKPAEVGDLNALPIGDLCRVVIVQGRDPDDPDRWPSRSEPLLWVCCELVRAGCDDATIQGVICDPENGISESVREQSRPDAYAARQIERAREMVAAEPPVLDDQEPLGSAREFVRRSMPHLMHHNDDWLAFRGAAYSELEDDSVRSGLYRFLDGARQRSRDPKKQAGPFRPTKAKVTNVADALRGLVHVPREQHEPPCWLDGDGPPPREIVACKNGLLHLPTGQLHELTPRFFSRNALDVAYEPGAAQPGRWLQFLAEVWPGEADTVATLQEVFGYLLVPDTAQQKILLLVGPPRSGKGTIARVLTELVGRHNVCAPTLNSLAGEFGLQPLIGKQLAIVSDMRLGGKTDRAAIAENLLRISGEDMVTANRKHKLAWTGHLAVRFLVMTNEIPRFADASGALASRFVPMVMSQSFLGREDPGLTAALLPELPGILNWAVEGWRRLRDRGHFVLPESAADTVQTMATLASPVLSFVGDRCELHPEASVPKDALYQAWREWCIAAGELHPGTKDTFGGNLLAAVPTVRAAKPRGEGGVRVPSYTGIRLHAEPPEPF